MKVVMYLLLELEPGGMIMTFVKAYPRAVAGRVIVLAPAASVNFPGGAEGHAGRAHAGRQLMGAGGVELREDAVRGNHLHE